MHKQNAAEKICETTSRTKTKSFALSYHFLFLSSFARYTCYRKHWHFFFLLCIQYLYDFLFGVFASSASPFYSRSPSLSLILHNFTVPEVNCYSNSVLLIFVSCCRQSIFFFFLVIHCCRFYFHGANNYSENDVFIVNHKHSATHRTPFSVLFFVPFLIFHLLRRWKPTFAAD